MQITTAVLGLVALAAPLISAQQNYTAPGNSTWQSGPDKNGKYWIYGDGISATFIPYGASVSNIFIDDKYGIQRDIVGGWDNASYYGIDKQHPHFGGIPGRYANRIKNSSFEIDGTTYHVLPNENPTPQAPKGADTLHGGPDGWDWRNWTVVSHTMSSITFSLVDPSGKEGFPGEVVCYVTYNLEGMDWVFKIIAISTTEKTPILLSSHVYWNLDGFANNETNTIFNHTLSMPYAGQYVAIDNIEIPTGVISPITNGSVNDFWTEPKQIGTDIGNPALTGNCGYNCNGYDNCYLTNRDKLKPFHWKTDFPVARLSSNWSGIELSIYTDQPAFQFYSCNGQNGSVALKNTQGLFNNSEFPRTIPKYGCLVFEVEDWIDGINNKEWMRDQIYGPDSEPVVVNARYSFNVNKD